MDNCKEVEHRQQFVQVNIASSRERKLQTLRAWWPQLTDDDWIRISGQREILQDVIREKYGMSLEIAQQDIERCFCALKKIC